MKKKKNRSDRQTVKTILVQTKMKYVKRQHLHAHFKISNANYTVRVSDRHKHHQM